MRRTRRVALALAVVLLAGCGSATDAGSTGPEAPSRVGGLEVRPSFLHGPGSRIGAGIAVPRGAYLVGEVFPIPAGAKEHPDRIAWMVLDGDPLDVWSRTTAELGVADQARAVDRCTIWAARPDAQGQIDHRSLADARFPGGDASMLCTWGGRVHAAGHSSEVRIDVWKSTSGASAQLTIAGDEGRAGEVWDDQCSQVQIDVVLPPTSLQAGVDCSASKVRLPATPSNPPVIAVAERDLPGRGDAFGTDDPYLPHGLPVPPGADVIAPSIVMADCNSGLRAVLTSTGRRPADVVHDLLAPMAGADQWTAVSPEPSAKAAKTWGADEAGGAHVTIVSDGDASRSYYLVQECGD